MCQSLSIGLNFVNIFLFLLVTFEFAILFFLLLLLASRKGIIKFCPISFITNYLYIFERIHLS